MRRAYLIFFALIMLITGTVYSQFPKYLYGIISWYGDDFAGKKTANGEHYDPQKYTAAHKTLPFGSEIMVENMENGRKLSLRINDRGPFSENRVLDVSKKAADELGFLKKGTVYAKITIIKIGDNRVVEESSETVEVQASSVVEAEASSKPVAVQASSVASGMRVSTPSFAASSMPSTLVRTEVLTKTNQLEVYNTNTIIITNYIPVPVTNIMNIPPYQDKIIEQDLTASNLGKSVNNNAGIKKDDDFIIDEPLDNTPVPTLDSIDRSPPPLKKSTPDIKVKQSSSASFEVSSSSASSEAIFEARPMVKKTPEKLPAKSPAIPMSKAATNITYNETEVTPEVLLSNEMALRTNDNPVKSETFLNGTIVDKVKPQQTEEIGQTYAIQVGAFNHESSAIRLYDQLKKAGFQVFTTESDAKGKHWIKVRVGYFNSFMKTQEAIDKLKQMKLNGLVLKIKK